MRVLISGAGIAGPTLAYFLARIGARVTVVEKASSFLDQGQNLDVQGCAVTVLKKMGVFDEVRRFSTTEKGTQLVHSDGRAHARFPLMKGRLSATSQNEILRGDLAAVLYRATKHHANVRYMFSTTLQDVLSNDKGAVKVRLSNGDVCGYDFLVAADGQWSKTRRMCFPSDSVQVVDKGMYAIYWTIPRLPEDNDWWNIYIGLRSRLASIRPDPHGSIRAMLTIMPITEIQKQTWIGAQREDRLAQQKLVSSEFADLGWQAPRLLHAMANAPDFYLHPIQQIKMARWSNSRVVCLGDAAYAPSPIAGSGTPLAIIGAYMLAGEVSKLEPDENPGKAFAAYESAFRPFVEECQDVPSFIPGIAHPRTALERFLMRTVLLSLSKVAAMPFTGSWLGHDDPEKNTDGFSLPYYPRLEAEE